MISDEPDEDADLLDDGTALETISGTPPRGQTGRFRRHGTAGLAAGAIRDIGLNLDAETLAWFKAANANWRREMRAVPAGLGCREDRGTPGQ